MYMYVHTHVVSSRRRDGVVASRKNELCTLDRVHKDVVNSERESEMRDGSCRVMYTSVHEVSTFVHPQR
jgi:hypothetical protein